jgi:hypothetical protein
MCGVDRSISCTVLWSDVVCQRDGLTAEMHCRPAIAAVDRPSPLVCTTCGSLAVLQYRHRATSIATADCHRHRHRRPPTPTPHHRTMIDVRIRTAYSLYTVCASVCVRRHALPRVVSVSRLVCRVSRPGVLVSESMVMCTVRKWHHADAPVGHPARRPTESRRTSHGYCRGESARICTAAASPRRCRRHRCRCASSRLWHAPE